jgi:hypothetical protein
VKDNPDGFLSHDLSLRNRWPEGSSTASGRHVCRPCSFLLEKVGENEKKLKNSKFLICTGAKSSMQIVQNHPYLFPEIWFILKK